MSPGLLAVSTPAREQQCEDQGADSQQETERARPKRRREASETTEQCAAMANELHGEISWKSICSKKLSYANYTRFDAR
jgi:hypothetical protein